MAEEHSETKGVQSKTHKFTLTCEGEKFRYTIPLELVSSSAIDDTQKAEFTKWKAEEVQKGHRIQLTLGQHYLIIGKLPNGTLRLEDHLLGKFSSTSPTQRSGKIEGDKLAIKLDTFTLIILGRKKPVYLRNMGISFAILAIVVIVFAHLIPAVSEFLAGLAGAAIVLGPVSLPVIGAILLSTAFVCAIGHAIAKHHARVSGTSGYTEPVTKNKTHISGSFATTLAPFKESAESKKKQLQNDDGLKKVVDARKDSNSKESREPPVKKEKESVDLDNLTNPNVSIPPS